MDFKSIVVHFPTPFNNYDWDDGTSLSAPIVSGIAALLMSYYPSLTAQQVKEIILKSGVRYDIEVEIDKEDGSKEIVLFQTYPSLVE